MKCPACGAELQTGQRFCGSCGVAVVDTAVHQATEVVPVTPADPTPAGGTPAAGAPLPPPSVAQVPTQAVPVLAADATDDAAAAIAAEPTAALTVVEQTAYTPSDGPPTMAWSMAEGVPAPHEFPAPEHFRITPLMVVGALTAILGVASGFTDVATFRAEGGYVQSAVLDLNFFSTNNLVGMAIAGVLLILGAVLGSVGRRVGVGIAGGAGLAIAGLAAMLCGQVVHLFDAAEVAALQSGATFTLTTTYEVGFYLAAAAGLLGVVAFVLAIPGMRPDGLPAPAPAYSIIGTVGVLLVVAGTLLPMNGADASSQFSNDVVPPITLVMRLVVLLLIALGGVVGFATQRRWGIGLALGTISVGVWQTITALLGAGDTPFPIAGGNVGSEGSALLLPQIVMQGDTPLDEFAPHLVTVAGVVVVMACLAGAWISAEQQR